MRKPLIHRLAKRAPVPIERAWPLEPLAKDSALTDDANSSNGLSASPAAPSYSSGSAPTGESPPGYSSNMGPGAVAAINASRGIQPATPPGI